MWRRRLAAAVAAGLIGSMSAGIGLAQDACTRAYREGLVLGGSERVVITEGVLCVGGDIVLRDNARLEIRNATLRVTGFRDTVWGPWAFIYVHDSAQVVMQNVLVEAPVTDPLLRVSLYGTSRADVDGVRLSGTLLFGLHAEGLSTARVRDARFFSAVVAGQASVELVESRVDWSLGLQFSGSSSSEFSGVRPGFYSSWDLQREPSKGMQLSLRNTYVGGWSLEVFEAARLVVRDSTLSRVFINLTETPSRLAGMRVGHHLSWSLQETPADSRTGNVTLINTTVNSWLLGLERLRGPLQLSDSQLAGLIMGRSTSPISFERTSVHNLQVWDNQQTWDCSSLVVEGGIDLTGARLSVSGSLEFLSSAPTVIWLNSSVGREYEVQVHNRDGQPARGLAVRVEDPLGRIITYTSDQDGVARFTIWFSDTTYDKTWHLLVPQGESTARVPITLLTSTPVQVTSW